jgi:hypothetical protein
MDESLLLGIKFFLEIGVICTIISILSITLFKKTKLIKCLFALSTFLLVVVIASGILLLNPIPKLNNASTKTPKVHKPVASKTSIEKKSETKVVTEMAAKVPKVETKKDNNTQSIAKPSAVSQSKARELVEAKIKSFGGQIKDPVKTVEEGWNEYYSFNVYEPKNDRYLSVFVNIATGELTNTDYGIDTIWN